MEFRILGPLEVFDAAGTPVRLPAGRERALLALLLLRRGEVVSMDALVDALWGDNPPPTAAKAIQGYVSHVRRLLEPSEDADRVLATQTPGYVLRVEGSQIDAVRFDELAAGGRRALEDDASEEAVRLLESALALWRGSVLTEFAFDDFAQPEIRRLEELRLEVIEDRADALLRLGRHVRLVSELEPLVAAHPLRGRLRGQLMLALYRSGRSPDALQVYHDGRRLLASELGLEPEPELRRLEMAILAQDPELETTAAPRAAPRPGASESAPAGRRRRRSVAVAAIAGLVVAAGALGVALVRGGSSAPVEVVPPAVVVIDPDTDRVVASLPVGSRPVTIDAEADSVWVGDAADGTVTRIDPATREVTKVIGIGAPAVDLDADRGSVWVATGGFGEVVGIDAEVGAITRRIPVGDPDAVVVQSVASVGAGDGRVWAGALGGLVRIDPGTGGITGRVDLGAGAAQQIAIGEGAVWATIWSNRARRVDASSMDVTAEFYAGSYVFSIAIDGASVWIGGDPKQVWKVDGLTGASLATARVGDFPPGIAAERDAVWVGLANGAVARLDPETADVLATVAVGGVVEDVAAHGGLVWLAVRTAD